MQRIVFFGNCQMGALAQVYQRSVVPRTHDHVTWVRTWEDAEPETYDALRDADLVVEQVLNTPLRLTLDQFETAAKVIGVPNVLNGFLWPYAGEPHPLNSPIPNRPQGPFIPDMSDRFLNRLIRKGVDPDEALRTYIEMDVVKISNVERVREISVGWQRSLDERCGFDFANTIERSFRDEHLFSHPGHPRLRFARYFVASVFRRIGVSVHAVEQAVTMMLEPPFPRGELPIHPKIAKFFDLKFVKPNQKYITITGEYLTFEEYFQRYLRYEWNNKLFQLTIRARDRNLDDDDLLPLIHDFRRELATSCVPSEGHFLLAKLLIRCGQGDKAVEVLRTLGLPLIGWREEDYRQISEFLTARGQLSEAESYIRMGIEAFPDSSELYHQLGVVLFRGGGWYAEAVLASRRALYLQPEHPYYKQQLAISLARLGGWAEAESLMIAAIALRPAVSSLYFSLSRILAEQSRWEEAIRIAESAIEFAPDTGSARTHIDSLKDRMQKSRIQQPVIIRETDLSR